MNQPALIQTQRNDYPSHFEDCWQAYPKRMGANPKKAAYRAYQSALRRGADPADMLAGVDAYAAYTEAVGSTCTQFVLRASTFFGPDEYWLEDWTPPETEPEWAKMPKDDGELMRWASEHGYPQPKPGETFWNYRERLRGKIEDRKQEK